MIRRRRAGFAVAAVAALALAGCGGSSGGSTPSAGGSSSSSGGGSGSNNSAPDQGVTKDSVTVGGVIVKSSAVGYSQAKAELGAKARFDRANAEGGVNGRKINFVGALDDHLDSSQDLQQVRSLVQNNKVFAVVPVVTPQFQGGGQFLIQQKIPFFGWGIEPAFCNNDYGFGFTGCLVPSNAKDQVSTASAKLIDAQLGIKDGTGKTVAMISEDSTAGVFGIKVIQAAFVADHWKVTYAKAAIPAESATSDYSPYSSAIMKSNNGGPPDLMFHVTTIPNAIGLGVALERAGFKGPQMDAVSYDPALLANAQSKQALQNRFVFIQYGALQNMDAAVQQMQKDVDAAAGKHTELTQDIAIGYWSADIFLAGLEKTGHNLTREAFVKTMNDNFEHGVQGGLGTVHYPSDHQNSTPCGSLVQVQGDTYKQVVPLNCYSNVPLSILGNS